MSTSAPAPANPTPISIAQVTSSTRLFRFGSPFDTGAVIFPKPVSWQAASLADLAPFFRAQISAGRARLDFDLGPLDRVIGMGESNGAVNKRGRRYRMFAADQGGQTPDQRQLYGSHPFFIVRGEQNLGVFVDYPGEMMIDLGDSDIDRGYIELPSANFDLYLISGRTVEDFVQGFLELVGAPCVPPLWAFGYQQCRYSYLSSAEVREVANTFRNQDIPCDAIYLDIDYLEKYKIFTVDPRSFGDLAVMAEEMKAAGFHLIPIIDPGVKVEKGYPAYESGIRNDCFCKDGDGEYFKAAVWPGYTHFPDFLNAATRAWWGKLYEPLVKLGISSFWNDMNEPAIFYTPGGMANLKELVTDLDVNKEIGTGSVDFFKKVMSFWQSESPYDDFYHTLDDGTKVSHREVHNLYGSLMAKATADGLAALEPEKRHVVISRSSYVGMHRYAVIWTGDNNSNWEDLLYHLRMLVSCNLVGLFYVGADIGGFCGDTYPELLIRWTQAGVCSPLFRNHSAIGSRRQEPWAFSEKVTGLLREAIKLRYSLIPYLYSEYLSAVDCKRPFIRGLFYAYDTQEANEADDQLLVGDSLMAAPVHTPNARGRMVHLPLHRWLYWPARRWHEREMKVLEPGNHYVQADLSVLPLFIGENKLMVLREPEAFAGQKPIRTLTVVGLVTEEANFTLRFDDGESVASPAGGLKLSVQNREGKITAQLLEQTGMNLMPELREVRFEIYDFRGNLSEISVLL